VVVIDVHGQAVEGLPVVHGDDVAGGAIVGRYLFTLGHRAIGFVADSFDNPYGFTSSRDRYAGFSEVLRELGCDVEAALGAHGSRSARDLALRLLTGRRPPTAIFAASDTQALGVMSAARDLGLQVPADLTVVGYDDIPIAEPIGLTTIRQHLRVGSNRCRTAACETSSGRPFRLSCRWAARRSGNVGLPGEAVRSDTRSPHTSGSRRRTHD
jgi:DNA-binding LacI/PurR family transcriptional regulator